MMITTIIKVITPNNAPSIVSIPNRTLFAGVCRSRGFFVSISSSQIFACEDPVSRSTYVQFIARKMESSGAFTCFSWIL